MNDRRLTGLCIEHPFLLPVRPTRIALISILGQSAARRAHLSGSRPRPLMGQVPAKLGVGPHTPQAARPCRHVVADHLLGTVAAFESARRVEPPRKLGARNLLTRLWLSG